MEQNEIPEGYCQCGCGQKTRIAKVNDKNKGWIKGKPLKYLKGHNLKGLAVLNHQKSLGRKKITSHGYVRVRTENGREYEHIIVMEKKLGRKLKFFGIGHTDNEVVHHIDGDRTNNSIENLLLLTHGEHTYLHHKGVPRGEKHYGISSN